MKQIAKSLVVASALAVAGSAVAEFGDVSGFAGLSYSQVMAGGKGVYKPLLPKSFPGATAYVGAKFHEYVGAKLGYTWVKSKSKTADVPANFDGIRGLAAMPAVESSIRVNTTFLDLVGFLPVMDCLELMGSVGYGYAQPKQSIADASKDFQDGVALKSKGVLRAGLGASYMFTDMVGMELGAVWQKNSSIKFKNNTVRQVLTNLGAATEKPLKDSMTFNAGVVVKF